MRPVIGRSKHLDIKGHYALGVLNYSTKPTSSPFLLTIIFHLVLLLLPSVYPIMPKFDGEKLNDVNHYTWAFAFTAYARTRRTAGLLDGSEGMPLSGPNSKAVKAWQAKANMASADIIAAIEPAQYMHVRGIEHDPLLMWTTLELFHSNGQARTDSLSTWNEFFFAKYTDYSIPLKTHLGNILAIVDRLQNIFSDPPSNPQIIARILASVPSPEFDNAIRYIEGNPRVSDRSFVIAQLLKEEFVIRRAGRLSPKTVDSSHAFHTDSKQPRCSNCKQRGHIFDDCFQPGGPKPVPDWYTYRNVPGPPPQAPAQANLVQTIAL
jgi:hypothetical protein